MTAKSGVYYFRGTIETHAEVEAKNDPEDEILLFNMRANEIPRVIRLSAGRYSYTQVFQEEDRMLEVDPPAPPPPETAP